MKKITAQPNKRRSGDGELIFIVYFFGKAKKILKLNFSAVVEHCGAAHFAENLMLIGDNDFCIYKGISVYNRDKIHIKPAVGRFKCPRVGKIVADIENYIIEFMGDAVIKNDIFACGGGIAETIADIKSERHAVNLTGAGTPIPNIVICPNSPAPIKSCKIKFPVESNQLTVIFNFTRSTQSVDFLIVIKRFFILCPRSGNNHGILRLVG